MRGNARKKKQAFDAPPCAEKIRCLLDALLNIQFICTSLLAIFILARYWSERLFPFSVWYTIGKATKPQALAAEPE